MASFIAVLLWVIVPVNVSVGDSVGDCMVMEEGKYMPDIKNQTLVCKHNTKELLLLTGWGKLYLNILGTFLGDLLAAKSQVEPWSTRSPTGPTCLSCGTHWRKQWIEACCWYMSKMSSSASPTRATWLSLLHDNCNHPNLPLLIDQSLSYWKYVSSGKNIIKAQKKFRPYRETLHSYKAKNSVETHYWGSFSEGLVLLINLY